jgi:hypothetical protein
MEHLDSFITRQSKIFLMRHHDILQSGKCWKCRWASHSSPLASQVGAAIGAKKPSSAFIPPKLAAILFLPKEDKEALEEKLAKVIAELNMVVSAADFQKVGKLGVK